MPVVGIADALGVQPVMNYAGYVLDNWVRIDKAQPIVFENIAMHQHFAGGSDEAGFVLTHVAIEAAAGPALDLAVELTYAADARDALAAEAMLHDLATVWRSEEHTSELQSLMRNSYAVFCLKKKTQPTTQLHTQR